MKIVFDNIVYSLQKAGGISVVWQELTSQFIKNGQDDLMFLEHETDHTNIFRELIDIPSRMIKLIKPLSFTIERYCNPTVKINQPFVFHSSYFRLCRNSNAKNITTVHDFTYEYFYNHKRKGWFLHVWQRNRAIRKSDAVVCISENTKRDLLKFVRGVDPNKIYVIPNGVSCDYRPLPESQKIEELKDWLLFVGGRTSYKNCYKFVEYIKETNYKVVFCGSKLTDDEEELFDKTIGKDRFRQYNNLSNEELNRIYNSVKCLVYPSSYEGFGIPVLEAQAAGCPVIALNASSIPEVLGDNKTLLLENFTQNELLLKIELLGNVELVNSVISSGYQNAAKYSWKEISNRYRELYSSLI